MITIEVLQKIANVEIVYLVRKKLVMFKQVNQNMLKTR